MYLAWQQEAQWFLFIINGLHQILIFLTVVSFNLDEYVGIPNPARIAMLTL